MICFEKRRLNVFFLPVRRIGRQSGARRLRRRRAFRYGCLSFIDAKASRLLAKLLFCRQKEKFMSITEIAPDVYRISLFVPEIDLQFIQFLVRDDEPLLFHAGMRGIFPLVREQVAKLINPADFDISVSVISRRTNAARSTNGWRSRQKPSRFAALSARWSASTISRRARPEV